MTVDGTQVHPQAALAERTVVRGARTWCGCQPSELQAGAEEGDQNAAFLSVTPVLLLRSGDAPWGVYRKGLAERNRHLMLLIV